MKLRKYANQYKRHVFFLGSIVFFFLFMTAGCTELERSGYSPIPQNAPAGWELNPYGDMQN